MFVSKNSYACPSDEKGHFAEADVVVASHDFQIEMWGEDAGSSHRLDLIPAYWGIDW